MSLEECDVTDLGHPQGAMLARRGHTIGKPRSAPGTVSFHTATSHAAVDDSKPDCDDARAARQDGLTVPLNYQQKGLLIQGCLPALTSSTTSTPAICSLARHSSPLPASATSKPSCRICKRGLLRIATHVQQAKICQISGGFCHLSLLCRATLGTADKLKGPRGCLESLWALHLVHHPGEQQAIQL